MKRVLLIGNGAREHAIAEALAASSEVVVLGKARNPGIALIATEYEKGDTCDPAVVQAFAKKMKPDFAVIGPDDPIVLGIADALEEIGIPCIGPKKSGAQLEGSKSFTRALIAKYQIPGNPRFETVTSIEQARRFMESVQGKFVVKADGLKGGKGVKVVGDHLDGIEDGLVYAADCMNELGKVVLEEKIIGEEFSLLAFVDGETVVTMPAVQDHKRAYENDIGPNTGGMGTYSDADHLLPFITQKDIDAATDIMRQTVRAMKEETGFPYTGILYGGFMAVRDGVRLIEYNARFGDPEALNLLPILETDFTQICESIIAGTLHQMNISFKKKATVCKYIVPKGYPNDPVINQKVVVGTMPAGAKLYYASVDKREDGIYMSSSRAIAVVGIADTIPAAEALAESAVRAVKGPVSYRKDIGKSELIQRRVLHMQEVRG